VKIAAIKVHRYSLPLTEPLTLSGRTMEKRRGLILSLSDSDGHIGYGECAPLSGFSRESLKDATEQLLQLRHSVIGTEIPNHLEELSGGFENWLGKYELSPSIRFGFESAVLSLQAARDHLSLEGLLSGQPRTVLTVNALLTGSEREILDRAARLRSQGWSAFKLKVGGRPLVADMELTQKVRSVIGPDAVLRLDANRRFSPDDFQEFVEGVRGCNIEYIEEPAASFENLQTLLESDPSALPIALDESLEEIAPDDLMRIDGLKAVVLKPTLLGLERAARFARVAAAKHVPAVISSSFESGVGLAVLARLAAALSGQDTAVGLDTGGYFDSDLLPPLPIINGRLTLADLPDIPAAIDHQRLEEITDG